LLLSADPQNVDEILRVDASCFKNKIGEKLKVEQKYNIIGIIKGLVTDNLRSLMVVSPFNRCLYSLR
jgi:hypothetical protein